jgi:TPR repeat protein
MAQDYAEAYKWFTLAMWKGNELAAQNRDALTDDMKPEQIAEGRQRAVAFAAQNKITH